MGPEITPQELRQTELKTVLRGVDRAQVDSLLETAATRLETLEAEVQRLRTRLDQADIPDLVAEFEAVGTEVAGILQAAREAANSMRERAGEDAATWRAEAMAEAEEHRRSAAADAEALRRDAWVTGSELLEQAQRLARSMRDQAERDVLTIQGEAEREAHRLTSGARREAEDVVRNAAMDAEKTIVDATRRRDDIIAQANRQASAAQERTRALEQRRDELLEELESVRATLTRLEGGLEERRDRLAMTPEPSSVKVIHPEPSDAAKADRWAVGETVRVVPPEDKPRYPMSSVEDYQREDEDLGHEPEVEPVEAEPERPEEAAIFQPEAVEEPEPGADEVESLFASLRHVGPEEADEGSDDEAEDLEEPEEEPEEAHDWIEERDSRLLPITNRALRGVKKAMTEMQNVALDGLRTDNGWRPAEEPIADAVRADLIALWTESYAAGHSVAEMMTGSKLKRPNTPHAEAPADFAAAVGDAVREAIHETQGQKDRQAAASRVFRLWRSDEAERWMRETAIDAYERGIEESLAVSTSSEAR